MLSFAAAIALALDNKILHMGWLWQFILWGLTFVVAMDEYRYSRFLFLFDASVFFMLSAQCPALVPLGAAALMVVALRELPFNIIRIKTWVLFLFLPLLAILDVVLVSYIYPRVQDVITKFGVPTYEVGRGWSPFLGSGDFVIIGLLMACFDMRWWRALVAYTLAILTMVYIPLKGVNMLPAVPFIAFYFITVGYFPTTPTRGVPILSGRGVWGLYWLAENDQNLDGDKDGEPKTS
jgi:hypothetical protein